MSENNETKDVKPTEEKAFDFKMKHEDIVAHYCSDSWKYNYHERMGGIAVACVYAYIGGVKPSVRSFAEYLGISEEMVFVPFKRLQANGLFSGRYKSSSDARDDETLLGHDTPVCVRTAWCMIAGIGSGFFGVR